jgi:hypothetical protein
MKANYTVSPATTETILHGCKIGQPDYMEEILYQCKGYVNETEIMQKGKEWADRNKYDRLRISKIDLTTPPNFVNTLTI